MPEVPEHEERHVREYVHSQWGEDDPAKIVQKIGSQRLLGHVYELYDVQCEKTRWWVISDPMNLYDQDDFLEVDTALTFHIGLRIRMAQHSRTALDEEKKEQISGAWRRFEQAVDAMNSAAEAEDFQAVGIKCREALLALVRDHADDAWLDGLDPRPKIADFKTWGAVLAEKLSNGRMRAYLKDSWMGHGTSRYGSGTTQTRHRGTRRSSSMPRHICSGSSGCCCTAARRARRRAALGAARTCSIRTSKLWKKPEEGYQESRVCRACEWRSERSFTSWEKHFEGADVEGYLNRPHTGLSDRLHRRKRRRQG